MTWKLFFFALVCALAFFGSAYGTAWAAVCIGTLSGPTLDGFALWALATVVTSFGYVAAKVLRA